MAEFIDGIDGEGAWSVLPALDRQILRDNATTLLGQVNEQRPPFTRADAAGIRVPTLLVGGQRTPGAQPMILRALAAHIAGAQVEIIPATAHFMFMQDPQRYCAAVLGFLAG